ncbi:glycerophosphodiester phosphodiesterase family protein [Erythrobacter sp. HA6-11]
MSKRTAPDWLTRWEYAHRGLHGADVPENSLEGVRLAIQRGMGVECDIQRSADSMPMVFHDWDLERLTGDQRDTDRLSAAEIGQLKLKGSDQSPPSLADLMNEVAGKVPILIEVKSKRGYNVERTCELVSREVDKYTGDHAVMSFDPRVARWFRRNSPKTCAGLVMREDEYGYTQQAWQRRLAFKIAKPDFLAYHIAALPNPWVAKLRSKGLPILTWTVNCSGTRARALRHTDALISEGEGLAAEVKA